MKPPKFSGPKDTISSKEWIRKMGMYFADAKVTSKEDKVHQALLRLTGKAYQYMSPVVDKITTRQTLGHTWATFSEAIEKVYGKKMDKEIVEKEIDRYFGDEGKAKIKADFFNWAQKLRTLAHLAETDNKTLFSQIKCVLQDKVHETLTTLKLVLNFMMLTDWEIYLDMAINMYKRLYLDKLKGKIFEEEKRKKSSGSEKTTEKANTSKPARADDKGKGMSSSSSTSNNKSDCRKHPGQHQWKDCSGNKNWKTAKPATSGSGTTKPSGSSSGSQQSGQKKLDPKKKYKVHLVTTQELATDDKDESPKATVRTLSATSPHILEEVVPLTPTMHISKELKPLRPFR
ncbi:hypothetical protein WOLCODRAFT_155159 [Wolfiporia cocos MD-104 SS10]|uniref:Uncharacterized protein n=1 Tax=Wolfiporia cocos (strain MD-104) TaxID=742152 RepID=A0A2H3IX16_WOLCO|nr:hypothetical protein WOLCODRAFT_155159 [Wolfiporia cocos MD-104 SS10]